MWCVSSTLGSTAVTSLRAVNNWGKKSQFNVLLIPNGSLWGRALKRVKYQSAAHSDPGKKEVLKTTQLSRVALLWDALWLRRGAAGLVSPHALRAEAAPPRAAGGTHPRRDRPGKGHERQRPGCVAPRDAVGTLLPWQSVLRAAGCGWIGVRS